MFDADDLRDWRGQHVVDESRRRIGTLEAVYFDTASETPAFASVQVGMVGRRRLTFAPLEGARVAPSYVRVMVDRKQVRGAPTIDTDGELTAQMEAEVYAHYGLEHRTGASGERRLGRR